jgi:tRNA1(Val) A37 N6-methylase TrmN6
MKSILYQSPDGYCYNSDSIFLFKFATIFKMRGNLLDIGCGVGLLGLLLGKKYNLDVTAVEKQESMYKYALKNFATNGLEVDLHNIEFQEFATEKKFDFIISNPPFYKVDKNQSQNSSINIARYEHHLPLEVLIKKSSSLAKPRGYLIICYDAWQSDDVIMELKRNKFQPEFIQYVHPKLDKEANLIMVAARKGSKARCKILPPLIAFDDNLEYTSDAKEAFILANTHSIKAIL